MIYTLKTKDNRISFRQTLRGSRLTTKSVISSLDLGPSQLWRWVGQNNQTYEVSMWKNKVSLFNCEDIFVSTQKVRLFITNPSNTYQLAILRSVNVETVVIYKWWIFAILPIVKLHGNWWDVLCKDRWEIDAGPDQS